MRKQFVILIGMIAFLVLGAAACSNDTNTNENKEREESEASKEGDNGEDEKNATSDEAVPSENILEWETSDFDESEHETLVFDTQDFPATSGPAFADSGTFVADGEDISKFYDYLEGTTSDFDLDDAGSPHQSHDLKTYPHVFGSDFYTVNNEDKDDPDQLYIVWVDMKTGEKEKLLPVDDIPILEKKGDKLFIFDGDNLTAYDTEKEKEVWEQEIDSDFSIHSLDATENSLVLWGNEGLVVHSQSDGENTYEADGVFLQVGTDGDEFYVAEESDETMMEMDESVLHIHRFQEDKEDAEEMFTTESVQTPDSVDELKINVEDDIIYIQSISGISAYDKDAAEPLWHVMPGEDMLSDSDLDTGDVESGLDTAYLDGNIYLRTTLRGDDTEGTLITVIDGKSGEMIENYNFDKLDMIGPLVDDGQVLVMDFYEREEIEDSEVQMHIIAGEDVK